MCHYLRMTNCYCCENRITAQGILANVHFRSSLLNKWKTCLPINAPSSTLWLGMSKTVSNSERPSKETQSHFLHHGGSNSIWICLERRTAVVIQTAPHLWGPKIAFKNVTWLKKNSRFTCDDAFSPFLCVI